MYAAALCPVLRALFATHMMTMSSAHSRYSSWVDRLA
jgi:hypothetical protein